MSTWEETKRAFLKEVFMFGLVYGMLLIGVWGESLQFMALAGILGILNLLRGFKK